MCLTARCTKPHNGLYSPTYHTEKARTARCANRCSMPCGPFLYGTNRDYV